MQARGSQLHPRLQAAIANSDGRNFDQPTVTVVMSVAIDVSTDKPCRRGALRSTRMARRP